MSNKKLTALGFAAVIMVILAIAQSRIASRPTGADKQRSANLIQGLDPALIMSIEIAGDNEKLILKRSTGGFVVANKDNYPALTKQINDLITEVLDIRTRDLVTSNKANHPDLEVTDDKAGSVVKFMDKSGQVLTGVIIGKRAGSGDSYIRPANSDDVYLSEGTARIRNRTLDYMEQRITDIKQDDIASVTVTGTDGSYTLTSEPNSTDVTLETPVPDGKKLKDTDYKQVFSALTSLRFEDVTRHSGLNFRDTYVCKLYDPLEYTIKIAKDGDETYVKCSSKYTGPANILRPDSSTSQEEVRAKEAMLLANDAAKDFNTAHAGWIYQISYQAENMTRKLHDLFEDEKKEEETKEESEKRE